MHKFSTSIYRTDNAILIADIPGKWGRNLFLPLGLLCFFAVIGLLWVGLLHDDIARYYSDPDDLPRSLLFTVVFSLWTFGLLVSLLGSVLYGRFAARTIRIDAESVRVDWRFFFFRGSRVFRRTPETMLEKHSEIFPPMRMNRTIGIGNRQNSYSWPVAYKEELDWIEAEIQRFFTEVPAVVASRDPHQMLYSKHDTGFHLLQSKDDLGQPLKPISPPSDQPASLPAEPQAGQLYVRCCHCSECLPSNRVLPDQALTVCNHCGSMLQIDDLVRFPFPLGSRFEAFQVKETLLVRQHLKFTFLNVGIVLFTLYASYVFSSMFGDLHYDRPSFLGLDGPVWFIALAYGFLWGMYSIYEQRTIEIDRETCYLRWSFLFLFWTWRIPRHKVFKATRRQSLFWNRDTIRLEYAGGNFVLERIPTNSDSVLLGVVNHYLFTTPALEPAPTETPTIIGGIETKHSEVRAYCPKCQSTVPSRNLNFAQLEGHCEACNETFTFAESPLRVFSEASKPLNTNLTIEKSDERIRFDFGANSPKDFIWAWLLPIGVVLFLSFNSRSTRRESIEEWWFSFLFYITIVLLIFLPRFLVSSFSRWTIYLDRNNLELTCRLLFLKYHRVVSRNNILSFSIPDEEPSYNFTLFATIVNQSPIVADMKMGSREAPMRLPGCKEKAVANDNEVVWIMNELNDFLGKNPPLGEPVKPS